MKEELLPRLRTKQRHTPRPDASIEDRAGSQPRCPYASAAGSGTAHSPQHLAHSAVPAIEARQFHDGESALAIAPWSEAVDRQEKARQLMQWAGEDGDPLATGGGIGGSHGENIERTARRSNLRNGEPAAQSGAVLERRVDNADLAISTD
jgi:hypothetical protein